MCGCQRLVECVVSKACRVCAYQRLVGCVGVKGLKGVCGCQRLQCRVCGC